MHKIIEVGSNGKFHVTGNDEYLANVLADIANNNTAFPDVVDLYSFKKDVKIETKDKDGNVVYEKVKKDALRVYFADGSWTDVVKSDEDKNDPITAILYAVVKRLLGVPTGSGYVVGNGFMGKLKKFAKKIRTEESDAKAKAERIERKKEEDRKAHEAAVKRHEAHPSIGRRLRSLEDKFNKLCEILTTGKGA